MELKIEVTISKEIEEFISEVRRTGGEPYLVSIPSWNLHIFENVRCNANLPPFIVAGTHVITESDEFRELIQKLGNLHLKSHRLLTNIGAIWGAVKLEEKKPGPKGDIFDYGLRQPGSFRSNG
ncbi:MAG: hypothetical protein DID89_2727548042 [Candidatus Nitrotoga sp. CP45]|nr:MAG: hypothetical protein DID89_2727548042 [Candidatus Nitrotoga sp. CP45]